MGAKEKLKALAAVDAAPAPSADPLDRLAEKANTGGPDDIVVIKISCTRGFAHTLAKLASMTRYTRNGLMKVFLEQGVRELEARIKAGKGMTS